MSAFWLSHLTVVLIHYSWFFGHISRKEAEKLLLSQELPRGAFLIRFAEHIPGGFSLTMRDYEPERGAHIKHYKIKCLDQGGFYVTTRQTFTTLPELVAAYMSTALFNFDIQRLGYSPSD